MDHYELLGIPRGSSRKEIKKAYKALAAKSHPDKKTGNAETHKALTVAYNVLIDPDKRDQYDQTGDTQQAKPQERWEILIVSLFDILIGQNFKGDIIRESRARLIGAAAENQANKSRLEQEAKAYRAKLGRVKTEGGAVNYYEGLVSQKAELAEENAKRCGIEIEAVSTAIEALASYTDTSPETPDGPPVNAYGGQGGTGGYIQY